MEKRVYRPLETEKDQEAVVSFGKYGESTFMFSYLVNQIREAFKQEGMQSVVQRLQPQGGLPKNHYELSGTGLDCKVLETNSPGWQKGKLRIKITVEFSPDEPPQPLEEDNPETPESELEKIRQALNS
jgi:hypothetical protein